MIGFKTAKTTTFFHNEEIIVVSKDLLEKLRKEVRKDPLGRARFCLHRSHDDKVQEMIIAIQKGSFVPPHRHLVKTESFHVIEGSLAVVFFNDRGKIIRKIILASLDNKKSGKKKPFLYRLSSNLWHTVVPMSELVIFHETTTGPFNNRHSQIAPWSPKEGDIEEIEKFIKRVKNYLHSKVT